MRRWILPIPGQLASLQPILFGATRVFLGLKYIDVLRREADGSWKLSTHVWSSNDSLPAIWK